MRAFPLVLCALLLAGCASDPPESVAPSTPTPAPVDDIAANAVTDADPVEAEAEPVARFVTTFANGSVTSVALGASEPIGFCCPTFVSQGENVDGAFTLDEGVVGIVAELVWTDPTFDLDLWIQAADYESVMPPEINGTGVSSSRGHYWYDNAGQTGSPDGHATLVVTDPEALAIVGEWGWWVVTKSSNATPFSIAVTLFYGEPPGETFTAFAPA